MRSLYFHNLFLCNIISETSRRARKTGKRSRKKRRRVEKYTLQWYVVDNIIGILNSCNAIIRSEFLLAEILPTMFCFSPSK